MAVTLTPSQAFDEYDLSTSVTCAAADTVTIDCRANGRYVQIAMPAGNITVANPTNPSVGNELILKITQDSVGSRTITWGAAFKKNLTLTLAANAVDQVSFIYDGTNWNQKGSALNLA